MKEQMSRANPLCKFERLPNIVKKKKKREGKKGNANIIAQRRPISVKTILIANICVSAY